MTKTRIGLDVDGVIANWTEAFKLICQKLHGKPDTRYEPGDWEWSDSGLTKAQIDKAWQVLKHTPNFWLWDVEPLPNTILLLDAVNIPKREFFFISNRVPTLGIPVQFQTEAWLQAEFQLPQPQVFIVETHAEKGTLAQELGLDWFLDDKPQNCEAVINAMPSCKTFLHKAKHNRNVHKRYQTVDNLNEFLRKVYAES